MRPPSTKHQNNSLIEQIFTTTLCPRQTRKPLNYDKKWGSEGDTYGHISTFSVTKTTVTHKSSFKLPNCIEMGEVAVSSNCEIIAALCVSRKPVSAWGNIFKQDLVEEEKKNNKGKHRFGWYEDSYLSGPDQGTVGGGEREVFKMYLIEWDNGVVSDTPSSVFLVNKAIGGWRYGHWALQLNAKNTVYSINLKTTVYGGGKYHEGDVHFAVTRNGNNDGKLSYASSLSDGWACARGHTLWNALTYNAALDSWGRWCWTDANADPDAPHSYATWFKVSE